MKLVKIELQGFKSFRDRSAVHFSAEGVNAILGPNGCGKSNLVDALKWALGEQSTKSLRGHSMQDVVFAGTQTSKPVGLAQVSLLFSNEDSPSLEKYKEFKEIQVSRKYYRNGESLYLINNVPSRLMDVREVFLDTGIGEKGYSIIEQGKIGRIVTSKPEELKALLDEAAGVMKFKTKKSEARKKLQSAQQNLLRVLDILKELEEREAKLDSQVKKLREYQKMKEDAQSAHRRIFAGRWFELGKQIREKETSLGKNQEENLRVSNEKQLCENKIETLEIESLSVAKNSEETGRKIAGLSAELGECETGAKLAGQSLENLEKWNLKGRAEGEKRTGQRNEIVTFVERERKEQNHRKETLATCSERLAACSERLRSVAGKRPSLEAENRRILDRENETKRKIDDNLVKLKIAEEKIRLHRENQDLPDYLENRLKDEIAAFEKRLEEIAVRAEFDGKAIGELDSVAVRQREALRENERQTKEKEKKNSNLRAEIAVAENEIATAEKEGEKLKRADRSASLIVNHLREHPEENEIVGLKGTLMERIRFAEELPERLERQMLKLKSTLVFERTRAIEKIVELAKKLGVGKLSLLFLDALECQPETAEQHRVNFWVTAEDPFLRKFLNRFVYLDKVEELPKLLASGIPGLNAVHRNFTIDPLSMVHLHLDAEETTEGLSAQHRKLENAKEKLRGLEERKRINEADVEKEEKRNGELANELEETRQKAEALRKNANSEKREAEYLKGQLANQRKDYQNLIERKRESESAETFLKNRREAETELKELDAEMKRIVAEKTQNETEENANREAFNRERKEQHSLELELGNLRNQIELHEKQIENRLQRKKELDEELAQSDDLVERNREEKRKFEAELEKTEERRRELIPLVEKEREAFDEAKRRLERLQAEKKERENQAGRHTATLEKLSRDDANLRIQVARLSQEQNHLSEQLAADFETDPETVLREFDPESFDSEREKNRLKALRQKLNEITNVNLGAIEEYEEIKTKSEFLREQRRDLVESSSSLEESIEEMDRRTVKLFQSAYEEINAHFKRVFPMLFAGGEASLELTDPGNLRETGLAIMAKPPGKRLQTLNLMSGGEKALTALAFVFAIFFAKPSPICVLDEVDAPLDDANVNRYANMLKQLRGECQFIVITHNKVTMSAADRMFGVTMQEPGVSRVVSVDFNRVRNSKSA